MPDVRAVRSARRYLAFRRCRERAIAGVTAVTDGLWLGVLDRDGLAAVDEAFFATRTEQLGSQRRGYTDSAWNERGLLDWERSAVERWFPAGGRVLVTGAGGGREVVALLERGFDAWGTEPNAAFVQAGAALLESRGHVGRLVLAGRDAAPSDGGPWDAVVVGWGSYMLIPERERRVAFLRALRAQMTPGGRLLVSFWPRAWVSGPGARATARTANLVRRVRGGPPVDVGDVLRPNYAHTFEPAEIRDELDVAGFTTLEQAEQPYGWAVGEAR